MTANRMRRDSLGIQRSASLNPARCAADWVASDSYFYKLFRWLRDEKLRYTTIRELHRLNDDYLDDIGIKKRSDIRPIANALVKRLRERRDRPRRF